MKSGRLPSYVVVVVVRVLVVVLVVVMAVMVAVETEALLLSILAEEVVLGSTVVVIECVEELDAPLVPAVEVLVDDADVVVVVVVDDDAGVIVVVVAAAAVVVVVVLAVCRAACFRRTTIWVCSSSIKLPSLIAVSWPIKRHQNVGAHVSKSRGTGRVSVRTNLRGRPSRCSS